MVASDAMTQDACRNWLVSSLQVERFHAKLRHDDGRAGPYGFDARSSGATGRISGSACLRPRVTRKPGPTLSGYCAYGGTNMIVIRTRMPTEKATVTRAIA